MSKTKEEKFAYNNKGQLSIFLGICLIIVMTSMAFIVNVGLFVKAKINLQNSVDAAAYAGASVQARQLSNIGYLNWEMRNTYKEWLFKYYVLGMISLNKTWAKNLTPGNTTNFRLNPFFPRGEAGYDPNSYDRFNVPSVCIHFAVNQDDTNICEIYSVPGLPRFTTVGLPSVTEYHEPFLNSIVETKGRDCSVRSDLNFATALQWVYGTTSTLFEGLPIISPDRVGSWIEALELALRMRNLEMIVNRPPVDTPICADGSAGSCLSVDQLRNEGGQMPLNERPIKAFFSAYRNLSGGDHKDIGQDEFSSSFKLTELRPEPYEARPNSASSFLIPGSTIGQTGVLATTKHYLDLQAYPLNLVNFFTTFVSSVEDTSARFGSGVKSEGACAGTKTALPVPGYIMGYVKNPEVLTYYAVKGEAKFVGLFFPFTELDGIRLTAYASAKPFGGRVGPRLFSFGSGEQTVTPRLNSKQFRSAPYVSGLNTLLLNNYEPGFPIPLDPDFWVKNNENIGGIPTAGAGVFFGVPNLLHDFDNYGDLAVHNGVGGGPIQILQQAQNDDQALNPSEKIGLYDTTQFIRFSQNLAQDPEGTTYTAQDFHKAIENARRPTKYEAMNYMIPTFQENPIENSDQSESLPIVEALPGRSPGDSILYRLFAPIYGDNTLYGTNIDSIAAIAQQYIDANTKAIDAFTNALKKVSDEIRAQSALSRGSDFSDAANTIHDGSSPPIITAASDCATLPVATKFYQFFKGSGSLCDIKPLRDKFREYLNDEIRRDSSFDMYLTTSYVGPRSGVPNQWMKTGYMPGPRRGAGENGAWIHPFDGAVGGTPSYLAKRNYYSTKFVATQKLTGDQFPFGAGKPSYMENSTLSPVADISALDFRNKLRTEELEEFGVLNN